MLMLDNWARNDITLSTREVGYPLVVVILIIAITAAAGFMASIICFNKQDEK